MEGLDDKLALTMFIESLQASDLYMHQLADRYVGLIFDGHLACQLMCKHRGSFETKEEARGNNDRQEITII